MNNAYIAIFFICVIILNCFFYKYFDEHREGFNIKKAVNKVKNFNPAKLIDKALGGLIDELLGSVPILKDIAKKVKKKKGLFKKIGATFYGLFISLLTIIFVPIAAGIVLYLGYLLFIFILANIPLLFKPTPLLAGI
tara:strand:+ start:214 stop:624 length:411 start_codon:yes stop_codon:yes gene_type:complete